MAWQPHGILGSGYLQDARDGRSRTAPAVAAYRGQLWCLWADMDSKIWYASTTAHQTFGKRRRFPAQGVPMVANLAGHLHAIITIETGEMLHYLFEEGRQSWSFLGAVTEAVADASPSLIAYHNQLFLLYLRDGTLYHQKWSDSPVSRTSATGTNGPWSAPAEIACYRRTISRGPTTLIVIDGVLYALCRYSYTSRRILGFRYDDTMALWVQANDVSGGRAIIGMSATSLSDKVYLAFIGDGLIGESFEVCVSAFSQGKWHPKEDVDGQKAADPPQLAILNGRLHCIFNDHTTTRDLKWYSRPILNYSPSSWMGNLAGDTLISHLTIPGTHDSCARGNIAFVRTQYLSITQQLALGIRFLDLRLRVHKDGLLYCYHGGYPIDYPNVLSFASVLDEVWTFLRGSDGMRIPTETVLISINNDDSSPEQRANPALFYHTVETAIAATLPYPDGSPRWCVEPFTPTLDKARGRAVLLRRYQGDAAIDSLARQGLDLSEWQNDNPQFTIVTPTNVRVHLQDKWRYTQRITLEQLVIDKSGHVQQLMGRAASASMADDFVVVNSSSDVNGEPSSPRADHEDDWFINFCSAVGDPAEHGEIAQAKWVAVGAHTGWIGGKWVDGMNVRTREYIQQLQAHGATRPKRRLGIVNLDFPELPTDNDIVYRLIEMNF